MDRPNTSHGEQWTHSFLQGQSRKLARSSHVQLNGTENYLETELGNVLNHDFSVMQDKKERGTMTRLLQLLSIQMVEYCVLIVMRNATIEWIHFSVLRINVTGFFLFCLHIIFVE